MSFCNGFDVKDVFLDTTWLFRKNSPRKKWQRIQGKVTGGVFKKWKIGLGLDGIHDVYPSRAAPHSRGWGGPIEGGWWVVALYLCTLELSRVCPCVRDVMVMSSPLYE